MADAEPMNNHTKTIQDARDQILTRLIELHLIFKDDQERLKYYQDYYSTAIISSTDTAILLAPEEIQIALENLKKAFQGLSATDKGWNVRPHNGIAELAVEILEAPRLNFPFYQSEHDELVTEQKYLSKATKGTTAVVGGQGAEGVYMLAPNEDAHWKGLDPEIVRMVKERRKERAEEAEAKVQEGERRKKNLKSQLPDLSRWGITASRLGANGTIVRG